MTLQRQITFWLIALVILTLILWLLNPVLLPFIVGLVLAYFLDPVADWLEKLGLPRLAATLIILALSLLALVAILLLIVPVLSDQLMKLVADLPNIMHRLTERFDALAPDWLKQEVAQSESDLKGTITSIMKATSSWFSTLLSSAWSGGMALMNIFSLLVITPIVAFYLLNDWDHMVAVVDSWLPRDHVTTIRSIFREIDTAMSGFIRGQGTVCLVLGAFYAVALSIVGLRFGLVIGMAAGFLTFIPYVGALIGGVLAVGVAVAQFWGDPTSILLVVGIFAIGQFVEGNFLSPKLVGHSVGIHPVWLMFALVAFGYLFGFVGLLVAVPLAAIFGVLLRFGLKQYLSSSFYKSHHSNSPKAALDGPHQAAASINMAGKKSAPAKPPRHKK